ncbi:MAG: PilZ domain-containing protein [Methylovulum sp.]|nr:MAG: PilZ domain-containing protein [Methylovulum sp.]
MTNSGLGSDKRQYPRIAAEVDYRLFLNGRHYIGKTSNISANGAFLIVPEPGIPHSCISQFGDLDIMLDGKWAHFRCEIVYVGTDDESSQSGAGVQNVFAKRLA